MLVLFFLYTQIWRQLIQLKCWELLVTLENNKIIKKNILHSIFLKAISMHFWKRKKSILCFDLYFFFFLICVSSNTDLFFSAKSMLKEMLYRLLTCDCCCFLGTFLSSVSCVCIFNGWIVLSFIANNIEWMGSV